MNRKTKMLLVIFLAMLTVVVIFKVWPDEGAGPGLNLPGWSQGREVDKAEINGPIDRVVVATSDGEVTLERVSEDKWSMSPPKGAGADRFKVRRILESFREDLTSVMSSEATGDDLESFGLDAENRITVTLFKKEEEVSSLEIGAVQKPEKGHVDGDTFVRIPGDDTVYRLIGRDLRRPFDKGVKGLRERRVFVWETEDVIGIDIDNPSASNSVDQRIELRSRDTGDEGDGEWRFVKPDRFEAGDIKSYVRTISSLYAQEFIEELPEGVDFDEGTYRVLVMLEDGKTVSFTLSAAVDDAAYLRVDGAQDYAKLSKHTAESVRKGLADLRDKSVFGVSQEEILKVDVNSEGKRLAFTRAGDGFRCLVPSGMPLGESQVDTFLRDVERLKAKDLLTDIDVKGEDTGLGRPKTTVTVTTMQGDVMTLRVGNEKDGGASYATVSGSADVMTIAGWSLKKLTSKPLDMRNKKLFAFEADSMRTVEIARDDETVVLVREPAEEDGDEPVWKATEPRESDDLAEDKVRTLVNTLAGFTVKGFAMDERPAGVGLDGGAAIRVTVTLDDGSKHELKVSGEKKDNDPYGASATEPDFKGLVFTLNQYQVKNFDKRLAELLNR